MVLILLYYIKMEGFMKYLKLIMKKNRLVKHNKFLRYVILFYQEEIINIKLLLLIAQMLIW